MDAIVAVYEDWGIGAEGTQPVTLSADRRYFREKTQNAWVIVGRKTLGDFPGGRPLPNRVNLVLTRGNSEIPGARIVHSPGEALAAVAGQKAVFVIGGASVYGAMLPFCTRVYVTKVGACPPSDVFFPNLDQDPDWVCADAGPQCWEEGISYRFCVYTRCSHLCGTLHLDKRASVGYNEALNFPSSIAWGTSLASPSVPQPGQI